MIGALFEQLSLFASPPAATTATKLPPKQRHLHLGNQIIAYTLRQGCRRRLSLTVDERGLTIGAPQRITFAEIERFASQHAEWVLAKLAEYGARHGRRHIAIRDGINLPLLGGEITVRIASGANRCRWQEDILWLEARVDADHSALTRRALQRRALALFSERLAMYAGSMGRVAPPLGLSSARTRWGSCSTKTGIRLNWRLIHLPLTLIDYVVAHELAHLQEMNHSPRFWNVVESLYPDWRMARQELKVRGAEVPVL
ncbi:MAG TPA: SprT family zinc-dependent metalloprotease [Rhodocyclaceae bacterium]|nr:SprT family zinc-dependent metalloprotease [Rhodocyclaceae bacterium]